MTAPVIQANYEQLEQVAARFGRATETQDRLMRTVRERADVLTRGSWEGEGVSAFARELDDEIMPAMQRLAEALQEAQRVTLEMSVVIRTAEEEAARLFISTAEITDPVDGAVAGSDMPETIGTEAPKNMADLFSMIVDPDAPPIRIIELSNGEYVVIVKGTDGWAGHANVWANNMHTGVGLPSTYTDRIREVIADNIPPGSTIHFAGHSQGGHAVQLVGTQYYDSGQYNIGSITSFGAYYSVDIPSGLRSHTASYVYWNDAVQLAGIAGDAINITYPFDEIISAAKGDAIFFKHQEQVLIGGGSWNPVKAHGLYYDSPILQKTAAPYGVGDVSVVSTIGYDAPNEPISVKIVKSIIEGDSDNAL